MGEHRIDVQENDCIGCGLCRKDCPVSNIELHKRKAVILDQNCMKCGHCVAICPQGAIRMNGFEDDLIDFTSIEPLDSQHVLHAMKMRRSVRHFQEKAITREDIVQILEAGRFSPTAENKQDVSYIVLQKDIKEIEQIGVCLLRKLWPIASFFRKDAKNINPTDDFFFKNAPVVILVVAHGTFASVDGSLASANMALLAESKGIGVLYSGFFTLAMKYSRKLRKRFNLKYRDKVIMTLVMGYPVIPYRRSVHRNQANIKYM